MPFLRTYNNDLVPGLVLQKEQLRGISRGEVLHGRYLGSIFEQHPHGRDGLWVEADGGVNTQISALDIRDVKPSLEIAYELLRSRYRFVQQAQHLLIFERPVLG